LNSPVPVWLKWVSLALLLWSLAGFGAFISQFSMSADMIAALPQAERDLWTNMPAWAWIAYAIATLSALGGAMGLLMKKAWAVPLYAVSIIGIIVQFSYPFLIARAFTDLAMMVFPIFILVMAVVQWMLTRNWRAKGWLT
jgi:uncharacterized membrane protein